MRRVAAAWQPGSMSGTFSSEDSRATTGGQRGGERREVKKTGKVLDAWDRQSSNNPGWRDQCLDSATAPAYDARVWVIVPASGGPVPAFSYGAGAGCDTQQFEGKASQYGVRPVGDNRWRNANPTRGSCSPSFGYLGRATDRARWPCPRSTTCAANSLATRTTRTLSCTWTEMAVTLDRFGYT